MLEIVILAAVALVPFVVPTDPAPGWRRTKEESRNLECERVSNEIGTRRYPGQIVAAPPRGEDNERTVVVCNERLTRHGLRPERDEAILSTLDASATDLASAAGSMRPDLRDRTWLVEAYYPNAPVAAKISFAAKNALMRGGLSVSDRTPTLAVGDITVLTRMTPDEAFPAACQRLHATGNLGEGDALLAIVSRDPRETILHAGLCTDGAWTWLK